MPQAPSYYTLTELLTQRQNAENFGMDIVPEFRIEIEAQRKHEAGLLVPTRPFNWETD